jgi:integrase/recombinase XerC
MPNLLEGFEAFLESGHERKTIVDYLTVMRDFEAWLLKSTEADQLSSRLLVPSALEEYMAHLKEQSRAPRTQRKILAILKLFCRWATDEGLLKRNPASRIKNPNIEAASHELTADQRRILKRLVENHDSPRLEAIFALGYWAGLRSSEVASLRVKLCNLNQRAGVITLLETKGGKARTLDLHNKARQALYSYLYETSRTHPDGRDEESLYVFTSQRAVWLRDRDKADHLSVRGLEHLWSHVKAQASVSEWDQVHTIRFHDLRHDFAHRARAAGWSLEEIAIYLGHNTQEGMPAILSTVRYTLPGREQLKARLHQLKG